MKRVYLILLFAALTGQSLLAQTCASPFAPGLTTLVETCTPSGAAGPYQIEVYATSDSAISITGLWEVPTATVMADIDCNTQTFTIARQPINSSFDLQGSGSLSGIDVTVSYQIYPTGDTVSFVDVCTANYQGAIVGTTAALQGPTCALYPNPATDRTILAIKGVNDISNTWTYRIVDVQGREVARGEFDNQLSATIQVDALSHGVYRVLAQDGAGQRLSKALVVE